jgi:hypothetical protein
MSDCTERHQAKPGYSPAGEGQERMLKEGTE